MSWSRGLWIAATVGMLCLGSADARALPASSSVGDLLSGGELVSGNGLLRFSDFSFASRCDCGVDPDCIQVEVLDDGLSFTGNESALGVDFRDFKISYSVAVIGDGVINAASLEMDSWVGADLGLVLASKKIAAFGDHPTPAHTPWFSHPDFGKSNLKDPWDWRGEFSSSHHAPTLQNGPPHLLPDLDWSKLARLDTFEVSKTFGCTCPDSHDARSSDPSCRFADYFDEESFAPQTSIRVTDTVKIVSLDRHGDAYWFESTNRFSVVPEPTTGALLGLGLMGLAAAGNRRRLR